MMIFVKTSMAPVATRFDHVGTRECVIISRKSKEKSPPKILDIFIEFQLASLSYGFKKQHANNRVLDYPHSIIPHEQFQRH